MRRHRDIDLGVTPVVPRHMGNPIYAGLGSILPASANGKSASEINFVNDYINSAWQTDPFSSSSWINLRNKFAKNIGMYDDSVAAATINSIKSAISADTSNPSFTKWDDTALGKFFAKNLVTTFADMTWGLPAQDKELKKVGNKMALTAYKVRNPDAFSIAMSVLASGPVDQYKEYLEAFGINNPDAKPISYWTANPTYDPHAGQAAGPSQPQTPTVQPPPFDYGKLNATDLALRDNPNKDAKKIRALNPPLYAKILGTSGTFVQIQLMDGTTGWTSSGSDTKAYWMPATQDEAYGKQPQQQSQPQIPPPQVIPQQIPTTPQVPVSYTPPVVPQQQQQGGGGITTPETPETPATPKKKPEEKSNVGLYVGIGAGVLVFGGLALYLMNNKD